jgi:hypothetical protein
VGGVEGNEGFEREMKELQEPRREQCRMKTFWSWVLREDSGDSSKK